MRPHRLALAFLLLAPVLQGCSTNPSTGRSQFIMLTDSQVTAMGDEAKPQVTAEFGGEVASPELRRYVDRVGRDLAMHVEPEYYRVNWEFIVLNSDVVNAFALPGGKVFITMGLLSRFQNEAQLAGVLGHEIGHVTARHVDERLSQAMVANIGLSVLGQYSDSEIVAAGAPMLVQSVLLKWGRSQETESDRQGLKYMTAAGYDPQGLRQVMSILAEASGQARPPEILSTHPYPERRLRDIERAIATEYQYTQNNAKYGLRQAPFDREVRPYLDLR